MEYTEFALRFLLCAWKCNAKH